MQGQRLDGLARILATTSRRQLLKTIAGGAVAKMVCAFSIGQSGLSGVSVPRVAFASNASVPGAARQIEYFALGDSIAAGHGLMDDGSPCRRSAVGRAYSYLVKSKLEQGNRYVVNFAGHFFACSGATGR